MPLNDESLKNGKPKKMQSSLIEKRSTAKAESKEKLFLTKIEIQKILAFNNLPKTLRIKLEKAIKPKKRIKPRSAKAKGRDLQNFVCERLAKITGLKWDNKDDNAPIQSRQMGQSGVDVILRGEASTYLPYSFECKATETLHLDQGVAQAKANLKRGTNWILVHKKNFGTPTVTMDWYTFERFIKLEFLGETNAV